MTPDIEPAVSFTCAVKGFGAVRAVDGVDLAVAPGETVALLGRNGAGKSTTISLLLGLIEADEGAVRLFGAAPERWLAAFGSYAVLSYRRGAGTI